VLRGDRLRARMSGRAVPTLLGGEHRADLSTRPAEVRAAAARLRGRWKEALVDYQPVDDQGRPLAGRRRPYASSADLSGEPEEELRKVLGELSRSGASVLFDVLLAGDDLRTEQFRRYLGEALAREGLRIRIDSDELHLPWPMFCLEPDGAPETLDGLFARFLGHRHQIEHTGDAYPQLGHVSPSRLPPAVSLNHDAAVGPKTRAGDVADVLAEGTRCTVRATYDHLVRDLSQADLDEQLMYFWCHGDFVPNGIEPPYLAIRLTDGRTFDGHTVRECRAPYARRATSFRPFVVLNACYGGISGGDADRAFLGRMLIKHGAQGVLGPQIEMPQMFAAEYALEFITRYLQGGASAGSVSLGLARHFAAKYRNPLGCAYALHCGMDARVERAEEHAE